jgi:two-component system, LuxR family, response regulator FixJ
MPAVRPAVYIIDDDASVRTALERLLVSAGIRSRTFASARDFLSAGVPLDGACVISDVKMHGMSGLELHQTLLDAGEHVSFIFVTAFDTEDARAKAKRAGAVAYFRKPVDDRALIDAIEWALSRAGGKA